MVANLCQLRYFSENGGKRKVEEGLAQPQKRAWSLAPSLLRPATGGDLTWVWVDKEDLSLMA